MSKKKKKNKETTIENYYDLKVDKVDELVYILKNDAAPDDGKEVSYNVKDCIGQEAAEQGEKKEYNKSGAKQFNPYKLDRLSRVPTWIKALVIKFWFAGMVCYIIGMGLGSIISSNENRIILTGVVLGVVVDVLANPAMYYFQSSDREYDPYIMFPFPFKKYWTFFTNIIYYVFVAFVVTYMYQGLNMLIDIISGTQGQQNINVGVEPLLYGLFTVIADMAFIGIKDLIVYLVRKNKNKKVEESNDV